LSALSRRTACLFLVSLGISVCAGALLAGEWKDLFSGENLSGWKASGSGTWRLEAGELCCKGAAGTISYSGPEISGSLKAFELLAEARTENGGSASLFFCRKLACGERCEVRLCNAPYHGSGCKRLRTGSLIGYRTIWSRCVPDGVWFTLRISVDCDRIRIWVNEVPLVDCMLPPGGPGETARRGGEPLSLGWAGGGGAVRFRRISLRPAGPERALSSYAGAPYGLTAERVREFARSCFPLVDYHVHIRGGMTLKKALWRQASTGIGVGVLRNIGCGWPIETDEQLKEFLRSVEGMPVFVGLQVNDRDWYYKQDRSLLKRLDYVLADTMIMPMPTDRDKPVKLWLSDKYRIRDPQRWMDRYLRHNLRVLSEPISILANPTYLPPQVSSMYDTLWTESRMRAVIEAAVRNNVALEINARSGLPHERFIRLAKKLGAKFSFGTNNFDDRPISLARCIEAVRRYGLKPEDMFLPHSAR